MVSKKIYMIIGMGILLLGILVFAGIVLAGDILTTGTVTKTYSNISTIDMSDFIKEDVNSKYGVVSIYGSKTGKIADISLIENTEECGGDIECFAIFKVDLKITYSDFIEKIDITKLDKITKFNIQEQQMLIKNGTKDVVVDNYQVICEMRQNQYIKEKNITQICENVLNGTKIEKQDNYIIYNGASLLPGEYYFKVTGKKNIDETVEWILTIAGLRITEYAVWGPTTLQETLGTSTIDVNINAIGSYKYSAFRFNATKNYSIQKVQIYVTENSGLVSSVWWGLYSANATRGINTTLIGSNSTSLTVYPVGNATNFTAVNNDSIVESGKEYWIVFYASGSANYMRLGETIGSGVGLWAQGPTIATVTLNCAGSTNVVKTANIRIWGAEVATNLYNITGKVVTLSERLNIANATILILDSTGSLMGNTTSNSTGDWLYSYVNNTIVNYTIVGYRYNTTLQEGNALPFFNA